ncbi:SIS domain-containing protein [Candidatus Woesearchaeota archaeon]|nr:SIS domain-containing protein [Candidatus Woesearchaeota archaeon]
MTSQQYIQQFMANAHSALATVDQEKIVRASDVLFQAWKDNKQVFVIGNGGSASNATHFAADLSKTILVGENKGIRALPLSDNIPLVSAWVNDQGWGELYTGQLKTYFQAGDIVVAFSVHGGSGSEKAGAWSQNLLKAVQYAKDNGGTTIAFSGFDGGPLATLADIPIVVPIKSTPHVEGLHAVLFHSIVFGIIEKIAEHTKAKEQGISLRQ